MDRRAFLVLVAVLGAARASSAQQGKVWRVGFLYLGSGQSAQETGRYPAFLQGMRELGYVEGRNLVIEARFVDGDAERLPDVAAALVRAKVDLIVTGGTPVNVAVRKATATIPIVMTLSVDPVADGLVASLARPGGNVTGLGTLSAQLSQKHLEMLSAVLPKLSRVGALVNSANVGNLNQWQYLQAAAKDAGVELVRSDARAPAEIDRALASLARDSAEALVVMGDVLFTQERRRIAELAKKHRLPMIALSGEHAEAGSLISYGPDLRDNFRRAAIYADRIFRGAKPGDLPIEQPSKFSMVINLGTARALGLTIPKELQFRADRVIE